MRKRIKARVREMKHITDDFAKEVFYKGRRLVNFQCESVAGTIFSVYAIRYKFKLYFVVSARYTSGSSCVKECIEL